MWLTGHSNQITTTTTATATDDTASFSHEYSLTLVSYCNTALLSCYRSHFFILSLMFTYFGFIQ